MFPQTATFPQQRLFRVRLEIILPLIVPAHRLGPQAPFVIKPQMLGGPLQGQPHGGIGSRNGITIAAEVDAERRIDPDGVLIPKSYG